MLNIEQIVQTYQKENALSFALSYEMPAGYDTAFGTYDAELQTLFYNKAFLAEQSDWENAFYLFHELRHALQYAHPELFSREIRESIPYVILYNGACYRLIDGRFIACTPDIPEELAENTYLSLPYELDANTAALEAAKELLPTHARELDALYQNWLPQKSVAYDELIAIFHQIDDKTAQIRK